MNLACRRPGRSWAAAPSCTAVVALAAACAPAMAPPVPAPATRDRPADDDLVAVVPADAEALLFVDLAQLRSSRWTREALAVPVKSDIAAGLGELEPADRLVVARLASTGESASLTVAQGRFERDRVVAAFRRGRARAVVSDFRGCDVWADGNEALAFLTARTLLSGPVTAVRGAVDASFGRAPSARGQRWVADLESALERERGPARTVVRPAAVNLAAVVTEPMRARLRHELAEAQGLERLGVRVDLGETVDVEAIGVARSRKDAADLAARIDGEMRGLRGRISLAALGLGPVLDGARVSSRGPVVRGTLRLNEAQRETIARRLALLAKILAADGAAGH